MKKIAFSFFVFSLFVFFPFFANASDYSDSWVMHQSWDLDFDWLNDCEKDNTCDHTVDYTKAKTYSSKEDFLSNEWDFCSLATDWCNNIWISDWEFSIATEMYCEDIYWEWWNLAYSCMWYDEEKIESIKYSEYKMEYIKYIRKNISSLTDEKPVLWWTWYVLSVKWYSDNNIVVDYEDWHVTGIVSLTLSDVKKHMESSKEPIENKVCTMEYAPVCAEVQVQCIKAPCYPVQQTFSNSCMAWDNPVLYTWQCNNFVDIMSYKKYMSYEDILLKKLDNVSVDVLTRAIDRVDKMIDEYLLPKRELSVIKKKMTQFIFVKELLKKELKSR